MAREMDHGTEKAAPAGPVIPDEEIQELIEEDVVHNAVPDPYHDTRSVHGDTGDPPPDSGNVTGTTGPTKEGE